MAKHRLFSALGRILFWRYPRGGWQYDILCALILLFIFLTPRSVFDGTYFSGDRPDKPKVETVQVPSAPAAAPAKDEKPDPAAPSPGGRN
ncbi:MAG: hypothetical protein Kow001_21050 [Acidobacteriota bacterium]